MTQDEFNKIGRDIIKKNIYLTLATSDDFPWATPLFYCVDEKFNFFFISQLISVHTQQMLKNSLVSFAIFDSTQQEGKGNGIQGDGKVEFLDTKEKIEYGLKTYSTTYIELTIKSLQAPAPYRLFKLIPEHLYILDPDAPVDKRVEIFLRNNRKQKSFSLNKSIL